MPPDLALDVCGLAPPEPMERILDALNHLAPGQRLAVSIDREPFPLYRVLDRHGYAHSFAAVSDSVFSLHIWRHH